MFATKRALIQFYQNQTPQTAAVAKKFLEADLTTLKVVRYYSLVCGAGSLLTLSALSVVFKGKNDEKVHPIIPIVGALAVLVFMGSAIHYLTSFPAQWVTNSHLRKIEKFESLSSI